MNLLNFIADQPWAIQEGMLREIFRIAKREDLDPKAVAAQLGRPLDNTRTASTRDGVAIIPISGPIFRHANMFTEISGATSIDLLARDIHQALHDPAVTAILFDIDSPGGEVNGTDELSDMLYAARGRKPMTAYVGGSGASAAYWLASAADEVVLAKTAAVGSIGIIASTSDPSKVSAKDIEFVSSVSPKKNPDPSTEGGKAQIQAHVDALGNVFVETVARNRGVPVDTVLADFGQGDVLVGAAAVKAGLADRVGSFEGTIARLRQATQGNSQARAIRARAGGSMEQVTIDKADHERLLAAEAQLTAVRALLPADVSDPVAAVRSLLPQAADGKAYRDDLVTQALEEGVRAYGTGFAAETYRGVLASVSLETVKQMKGDWQSVADKALAGGRTTIESDDSPTPASATAPVPDAAFAG